MSEHRAAESDAPLTDVPFIKAPMPDRRDFPRDTAESDAGCPACGGDNLAACMGSAWCNECDWIDPPERKDADTLRAVVFRMAEDINRIKRVCTQEHPPKMGGPTRDWPAGTETRHGDGSLCVLLNDGDYAHVLPPAKTKDAD